MCLCYNKNGEKMKIQGKTKVLEAIECRSFLSRFKGNMGKKKIDSVLIFPRCNSIHTFFMRTNIDVVMLSKEKKVLYLFPSLSPWHILLPKKGAVTTLEFPEKENPYQLGDIVKY